MTASHKTCTRCREEKPLESFSPKKGGKHGRRSECKECRRVPHLKKRRDAQALCEERAAVGEAVKLCMKCEQCKPLSEFYDRPENTNGKRSYCKQCQSEYYFENSERAAELWQVRYVIRGEEIKAHRRAYYRDNKQHENQRNRRYYRHHQKQISVARRDYRRRKPEVKKAAEHRRMARKRELPHTFTDSDWLRALEYFGGCCAVCGRETDDNLRIVPDHWIPLASPDCPGTVPDNIVPLCHGFGGCNNEKQNILPEQWLIRKFGDVDSKRKLDEIQAYFDQISL